MVDTQSLSERYERLCPRGAQTYSKAPRRWPDNAPRFLLKGEGAYVWDIEGRKYLDYDAALGPVILGYNHPKVNDAIQLALKHGISFPLPTYLDYELAKLLVEVIPCAEAVAFGKNGADATAAAVRLARAWKRKQTVKPGRLLNIIARGYHGYHDWCIEGSKGLPLNYEGDGTIRHFNSPNPLLWPWESNIAAVIMEPVSATDPIWPENDYLGQIRALCDKHGALLIFDEVFTGFSSFHFNTNRAGQPRTSTSSVNP